MTCKIRRPGAAVLALLGMALMGWLTPGAAAPPRDVPVLRFDFGTPTSVVRDGFIRITPEDAFTPQRGYGFESTDGLTAYDRSGGLIKMPEDAHTASAYGAYRTASDITCDFIESERQNAFVVAVPDGEYTVWAIVDDAEWDPQFFEIWANGAKQAEVRLPRARFVFLDSFQVRATGGRLRLEFRGPHGWLLNGLVIGKKSPELDRVAATLQRDIFFLTEAELPNWTEVKPNPVSPPLTWTAAEEKNGYLIFASNYMTAIPPNFIPARASVGRPLTAFATPGEFEPATFGLCSRKDLGEVSVTLSDFVGESGRKIGRGNVNLGTVRFLPRRWGERTYQVMPDSIQTAGGRASRMAAGEVKQWWLTVHVPPGTPAGRYRMRITVKPEKAPPSQTEWQLIVLPFELTRPTDKHWGTWPDGTPLTGYLRGPERRGRNVPQERVRLVEAELNDYRDHGFDLIIMNYYFGVDEKPGGGFTYDLGGLPSDMESYKRLGKNVPVAVFFEYTCRGLEEGLAEPEKPHVPGAFSPKAHEAVVGLVKYIHDEAQRRGWPKIYYAPIDEPGNNKTDNRMTFSANVLDFVHEVPGCETAVTVSPTDLQQLGENRVDVRIYSSYNRSKAIEDAKQGRPFWYYANGAFYGHSLTASRETFGFGFLRSGAEAATAWGFASAYGNPENDFDSGHRDWNVLYPGVDGPVPTVYWEACREGVDDVRYVTTLQEQIRLAKQRGNTAAATRAEAVLAPLLDPSGPPLEDPLAYGRYRWRVAREILTLLGDKKSSLSFTAVTKNATGLEKLGPNLILDPSFEAGPQADGLPTGGYHIADPYARAEQKPIGALRVSDEVAHTGRYALKWDFSQVAGKGAIYDGQRYLVVNVQVPPEAAKRLRGKRVKVGYWYRLGGGALAPELNLRQFGKSEWLGSLQYGAGVEDPAVWNHFEIEGRLRADFESLDIHIPCRVPEDAELAAKSFFYIDDVSLEEIEEPPVTVATSLDEYYRGEPIPWTVNTPSADGQVTVTLCQGKRIIGEKTLRISGGKARGEFESRGLRPGVYTLHATLASPQQAPAAAEWQVILSPNPFAG